MIYCRPSSFLPPFLIPDNCTEWLLTMSRLRSSHVTGVVTCHDLCVTIHHIVTLSLACGCWELCWCRNCHDWSSQGSSWFTLKVQCQQCIIQTPIQEDIRINLKCPKQRMTKNQLRIICLFLPYPSSLNFLSCWPEKESSVVLRTTDWKYFQSTDIFNRTRLRQGFKSNLSKTFPIHLEFVESWTFKTIFRERERRGPKLCVLLLVVRWGNCGLLCNFNLAIT